jgi:N-formylglutamate amidohydrolase
MLNALFEIRFSTPIIATAIHNGHLIRKDLRENLLISADDRRREEDPYTNSIIRSFANRIVVNTSRFEVDLNRRREAAIYQNPEDCWGLEVWKEPLTDEQVADSLAEYDHFYRRVDRIVAELIETFGFAIILDVHSYNHHRMGSDQPYDCIEENPQVILGTNNMPEYYLPIVEKINNQFSEKSFLGEPLDCRVNVKFPGGNFPRHLHRKFPNKVFALAIEFKKTFIDEWSGELFRDRLEELIGSLHSIISCLQEVKAEDLKK